MKKKLFIVLPIVLIISVLIGLGFYWFALPYITFNNLLKSLEPQGEMPCYALYDNIYDGDYKVNIEQKFEEQFSVNINKYDIFAKVNDRYYYLFEVLNGTETNWYIVSHAQDSDMKVHYQGVFYSNEGTGKDYYNYNGSYYYPVNERNGFYYDRTIYLTDFKKVVMYEIDTDKISEIVYSDFKYPSIITAKRVNFHTIELYDQINKKSKTVTFQELAQENSEINKVYELDSVSATNKFFNKVQIFENKIYFVASVLNYSDASYTMVLQYDYDLGSCKYLGYTKGDSNDFLVLE